MVSDAALLPWLDLARGEVSGLEPLDAHTHLGSNDPDGYRCTPEELTGALTRMDGRAIVFPMHEPDGYATANDMIVEQAGAADGRLFPFCRLNPHDSPLAEAERSLRRGALGIKLHPRAEEFTLDHPALDAVFALADAERLPVLCHAGRGIPALGRHAVDACRRYPGMRLILAHAGISDLAWIWRAALDLPNLYFDTAWWTPSDLQALFALVPPGQILMASDAPYTPPAFGATLALRNSLQLGLDADQIRGVVGEQAARLLAREEPLDLGPAPGGDGIPNDPLLDRVYAYLLSAIGQMIQGVEPTEILGLAALACEVGDEAPQAPVCRAILSLLEARSRYDPDSPDRPPRFAPGTHFIVFASGLARTPDVPLVPPSPAADVDERLRGDPTG